MTRQEYETGHTGVEFARGMIEQSVGRKIARIGFGPDPSKSSQVHHGEWLTFYFTDGTYLELELGSNAAQLRNGVRASEVSLSFIASFIETARS